MKQDEQEIEKTVLRQTERKIAENYYHAHFADKK